MEDGEKNREPSNRHQNNWEGLGIRPEPAQRDWYSREWRRWKKTARRSSLRVGVCNQTTRRLLLDAVTRRRSRLLYVPRASGARCWHSNIVRVQPLYRQLRRRICSLTRQLGFQAQHRGWGSAPLHYKLVHMPYIYSENIIYNCGGGDICAATSTLYPNRKKKKPQRA